MGKRDVEASEVTVSIVGGGSVDTSWCYHFVQELATHPERARGLTLRIHEPRERVGRGVAYADDLQSNLLNVTVGAMSVAGDDKMHFKRWLDAKGIGSFAERRIESSSFVSRELFGRYLEHVFDEAVATAVALGANVVRVHDAVISLNRAEDSRWTLQGAGGGSWKADRVVLAVGNLRSTRFEHIEPAASYAPTPYPTKSLLDGVGVDARIGILGTSLSAVDAIVGLLARGHRGPIYAVSRNGRLPSVRGLLNPPLALRSLVRDALVERKRLSQKMTLEEVFNLIRLELVAAHGAGSDAESLHQIAFDVPDPAEYLDREIEIARTQPRVWQAVANALNSCVDLAWDVLDREGRQRFEQEWRPSWMARRVSFPLENALILRAMLEDGRLEVRRGFESVVSLPGGGYSIRLSSSTGEPEALQVDALVDATGFSTDVTKSDSLLVKGMLASGLAVADPFGGIRVDFDSGAVLGASDNVEPTITVLGSLAAGTYFWTNAMEVNARLAMNQARALSKDLGRVLLMS